MAFPSPRLSAWMPPDSTPLELRCGPFQITLARCGSLSVFGIANTNIAQLLAVPFTSISVLVAVTMAFAAGLYSQASVVSSVWIISIVNCYAADCCSVRTDCYIGASSAGAHTSGVSGVDGVDAAWAGRDDDIDTRQKRNVGIVVDAGRIRIAARRAFNAADSW